jgi:hypothetical protein
MGLKDEQGKLNVERRIANQRIAIRRLPVAAEAFRSGPISAVRTKHCSTVAIGNAGFIEVVWGHLDVDLVANPNADEVLSHFP